MIEAPLVKYNPFAPNLTREDGKALLMTREKAQRSGLSERLLEEYHQGKQKIGSPNGTFSCKNLHLYA